MPTQNTFSDKTEYDFSDIPLTKRLRLALAIIRRRKFVITAKTIFRVIECEKGGYHDLTLACGDGVDFVYCRKCNFRTPERVHQNDAGAADIWEEEKCKGTLFKIPTPEEIGKRTQDAIRGGT